MRPADFAAVSVAIILGATILAAAVSGASGAAAPVRQGDPPSAPPPEDPRSAGVPPSVMPKVRDPELGTLKLRMGTKRLIYIYAPTVPADPTAYAALYFSGEGGWRPLQQDTAAFLADRGRYVVGFDASDYFTQRLAPEDWADDLATLASYANEKARKPPGTPVLLIGFAFGGELIPYMLNRGGTRGFAGALLVSLGEKSSVIYRLAIQLKLQLPPDEVFSVGEEIHQLPGTFPVFLMDGSLDQNSALKSLVVFARGPKRFVTIEGADHQFRKVRDAYFAQVFKALTWLEGQRPDADAPAPGAARPEAAPPAAGVAAPEPPTGQPAPGPPGER